jgi:uncharacterized protein (TIGR02453 family)
MTPARFDPGLFAFLRALARSNSRDWFHANKARWERSARDPALALVADLAAPLARISPHMVADPARVGGSLFRIQRDTRFASDKQPYKTWIGLRLYHQRRREVHAPSFYIHLQPGNCFVAGGLWRPEPATLKRLREFLADNPAAWRKAARAPAFLRDFEHGGEALSRPPRGWPTDHPLIEDLKRKDFIAWQAVPDSQVLAPGLDAFLARRLTRLAPLVDYLCAALDLEF